MVIKYKTKCAQLHGSKILHFQIKDVILRPAKAETTVGPLAQLVRVEDS